MLLKPVWPQEGREEIAVIVELVVIDDEEDVLVVVVWGKDFVLLVVVMEDEDWIVEEVVLEERELQLPNRGWLCTKLTPHPMIATMRYKGRKCERKLGTHHPTPQSDISDPQSPSLLQQFP